MDDPLTRVLPALLLLACPLMMLVCLWGMRGSGRRDTHVAPPEQELSAPAAASLTARVAELEREVAALRAGSHDDPTAPAGRPRVAQDANGDPVIGRDGRPGAA